MTKRKPTFPGCGVAARPGSSLWASWTTGNRVSNTGNRAPWGKMRSKPPVDCAETLKRAAGWLTWQTLAKRFTIRITAARRGADQPERARPRSPPQGNARALVQFPHKQLRVNHNLIRAKAAESAAPGRMRRVEPYNNASGHRHNPNDLATGLRLSTNANAAPNKEHIERRVVVLI
jgi:hypothetical protein